MVCNHWWHDPRRLLVCDPRVFEVQRTSLIMTRVKETVKEVTISTSLGSYALFLHREDLTDLFPTMVRYTLTVDGGGERRVLFCTNSYEYAPLSGLDPESITIGRMKQLESALRNDPVPFLKHTSSAIIPDFPLYNQGVAIIQGSPRAEGNCSILAEWVLATATANRRKTEVIFPPDMDIHPCIGCYRCYNTGRCTYDDDMTAIINTIRNCSLLVICTPVYTNTVPGSLKLLIDRCQAFHAE